MTTDPLARCPAHDMPFTGPRACLVCDEPKEETPMKETRVETPFPWTPEDAASLRRLVESVEVSPEAAALFQSLYADRGPLLARVAALTAERDALQARLETVVKDGCDFEGELIRILGVRPRVDGDDEDDQGRIVNQAMWLMANVEEVKRLVAENAEAHAHLTGKGEMVEPTTLEARRIVCRVCFVPVFF